METKAKRAFEAIGYALVRSDDEYVVYEKEIDGGSDRKIVDFCSQLRSVRVSFENGTDAPSIGVELLEAMAMQAAELGWTR